MSEKKIYFPDITPPSYPFGEEAEDVSIISNFEDGSQQSRVAKTRGRRKFNLTWKRLSDREYRVLMHFIRHVIKNSALSFYWMNNSTYDADYSYLDPNLEEVKVRCTNVGKWEMVEVNYWSGSLELTEV